MAAKQEKHIHRLKRIRFKSGNTFLFCTLPDCTFKINPALALGKRSICWRCGSEFILNEYSLRLAKPHCDGCHKPKKIDELPNQAVATSPVVDNPLKANGTSEMSLSDRLKNLSEDKRKELREGSWPVLEANEVEEDI